MTAYHNRRIYDPQPNDLFNQQIRIDNTKICIPWCHRSGAHWVEQSPRAVANEVFNLCVCVCGAHPRDSIIRPGRRGDEASCRLNAFPKCKNIELGRKEASVDKRGVKGVVGVYCYGAT